MNESKILKAIYLAIALTTINIAATGYLIYAPTKTAPASKEDEVNSANQIPKKVALDIAQKLVESYNNNDVDGLYAQFADVARMQVTKEKLTESMQKLHALVGRVDDFAYSHSALVGNQDGKQIKTMFYKLRLSGGSMPIGELKITVAQIGENIEVYGFFINGIQQ